MREAITNYKLPKMASNNLGYDKDTTSEKEYFTLASMRVSKVLSSISLAHLKCHQHI